MFSLKKIFALISITHGFYEAYQKVLFYADEVKSLSAEIFYQKQIFER